MSYTNRRSKRCRPRVHGTIDDNLDVLELEKSIRKEANGGLLPGEQQGRVWTGWLSAAASIFVFQQQLAIRLIR